MVTANLKSQKSKENPGGAVDDPGGGVDDPGGGNTDDMGPFACHSHCDFLKDSRVVCLLFFDDWNFFVVPFGFRASQLWMWWVI